MEYVKVFVTVPLARAVRAVDGRAFEKPLDSLLAVIGTFADRGVGVIGNYDNCSFTFATGTGRYRAMPGANPTMGTLGEVHAEEEAMVSFVAPKHVLADLVRAIKDNHPYETPAIDAFDLVLDTFDGLPS